MPTKTYDADKNHWHDIGQDNAISHTILAWKEREISRINQEPCLSRMLIWN